MTKLKSLSKLTLIIALLATAPVILAHEAHCKDTKLGDIMSQMKKPYKALKRNSDDFTKTEQNASKIIELMQKAAELIPLKIEEGLLDKEKLSNYHSEMKETNKTLQELVLAAQSKDEDRIETLLKTLNKQRKKGHKAYRLDCD